MKLPAPMRYDVADDAPTTLRDVVQTWGERRRLRVWAGASDATIWGSPEANWRFRAWHDACHVVTGLGFDVADEVKLAEYQRAQATGDWLALAVWVEVAEQALHYGRTGEFVNDQVAFARARGVTGV